MNSINSEDKPVDQNGRPYNRLLLVFTLLIGTFSTFLTSTMLTTAFPTLMKSFSISANTVQWLTTGFMLMMGIVIPITGFFLQRFDSRKLYLSAIVIFFVGTIVCYFAQNFWTILAGRLIEAAGVGITSPVYQTIMTSIFPPAKRGAAMGSAGIVVGLAPAIGPTFAGWILIHYSWRMLFLAIIPISLIVLITGYFTLRKVLPTKKAPVDWSSVVLSMIGFGSMLFAFSSVGTYSWTNPIVYGTLIVGVLVVAIFIFRSLKIKNPLLQFKVFEHSDFTLSAILVSVSFMSMNGFTLVLPLYLQTVRGESPLASGLTLLPGAIMMGVMNPTTGRIFDRLGARDMAIAGMFILSLTTASFIPITAQTPVFYLACLYTVRMFGISMVMMPVTTTGMNALPLNLIGDGTVVNNTARQVFASMGTAILVSIMSSVTLNHTPGSTVAQSTPILFKKLSLNANVLGFRYAFLIATTFAVIGFLLTFFLKKDEREGY
ncbi:multidrug efflux MFS transporter [Pediococcus ethanolidurans]|uniref:MDR family MFS transporter n=1 Tax=Pediococcus ethanolidurans TaxID=319653 RepID=UPI001C1E953C|nr:MDR family MFS transporter [Pediococcus ethanolidurans]MBU7553988.1 multidrug efflux MFS transporter [Pediococcus ethanolidurans]MBU7563173.1 multidrug efflux MFS transporter [Pediococcus ethanolidurans]MCT4398266.1 DHA2 family efflux MFS transporter permease subunit [Pediococcus ethanolidurans]MCV3323554.1 multidrug efflux MFS transporter [Pediococcus ethanolidurans]MCV3327326.1 multidrug efflux MFS transporter [Pediococcus ethanolidurans]